MLSSKADQHDWFVVLILKSQCCLTIVDKVKQHEPPSSHDDSHCDTLSWLVTLVTSHASLCFEATLNNSQSFNKLQRVSAKPTVSLDRDTVPEHADMFLLSCIIRAQGAWTIYRLPPPPLTILPLEAAHCAPYVAIPYCIMQWYNRLICMLPCRGGILGWLRWLTSISLPSSELSSCWGVNFPHPHVNTDLGCHLQWGQSTSNYQLMKEDQLSLQTFLSLYRLYFNFLYFYLWYFYFF